MCFIFMLFNLFSKYKEKKLSKREYVCAVCFDILNKKPIFFLNCGHVFCDFCKPKLYNTCHMCRNIVTFLKLIKQTLKCSSCNILFNNENNIQKYRCIALFCGHLFCYNCVSNKNKNLLSHTPCSVCKICSNSIVLYFS